MTIKIKIVKLDKRNTGYGKFKYVIYSVSAYSKEFHDIRAWMWETWGASKEIKEWMRDSNIPFFAKEQLLSCQNEYWCWQNDGYYRRLYLQTDKELMLFKLRWE
jgi:hypothetical protein